MDESCRFLLIMLQINVQPLVCQREGGWACECVFLSIPIYQVNVDILNEVNIGILNRVSIFNIQMKEICILS